MRTPNVKTIFSDPLEVGHPAMLLWEFCWRGTARSFHFGAAGGIAAVFIFPQTIPAYYAPFTLLPHLMLFAILISFLYGGLLGGFIGILLGLITLFLSHHKFYKLIMVFIGLCSGFALNYLCLIIFFETYSVNRPLHLAVSLHGSIVASMTAGYFAYEAAVWRKKAKKKRTPADLEINSEIKSLS